MAEKRFTRRQQPPRQEWKPHWILRLAHTAWMTVFTCAKIAVGAAATVAFIGLLCGMVFAGILANYLQEDIIPNAGFELEAFDLDQTSFLYYVDNDGKIQEMQQIYASTDRQWASYEELPQDLVHAAVAIEDKRFYEHQGVDWITTSKACVNMFFGSSSSFGGSTITQQLIKNLTDEDSITVQRKVQEIFRAQLFERAYTKDVVMEWYLNTIYLGEGCGGVKSAAATYFGKTLDDLTTAECASLISITNNPSLYDPYISMERNRKRQLTVLDQMKDQEWITEEQYEAAVDQELVLKRGIDEEDLVTATCGYSECGFSAKVSKFVHEEEGYFCPQCGSQVHVDLGNDEPYYSWFTDLVINDVARALADQMDMDWNNDTYKLCLEMIKRGGYHIYTTIDMDIQRKVDEVYTNVENIPSGRSSQQLQSAIVVIDNSTGDIVALEGGVGKKENYLGFSRATDSRLQTGSSMKPLAVYAPAFECGAITPASIGKDMPLSYENGPFPLNDSRTYSGYTNILRGITSSLNAVSVNTLDGIGLDYAFDFAKNKFGLRGLVEYEELESGRVVSDVGYSPLGMGALTYGVSVRDMASAYSTFANNGMYRRGRTFTKVYDSEGNLVIDNVQEARQILSQKTINYMNYCLKNVVDAGTGYQAAIRGMNVYGKTGTTSSNKDRWFCGFTGYYTAAVWCGYDNPEEVRGVSGNPSANLWHQVMVKLLDGKSNIALHSTNGMVSVSMCMDSGKAATAACAADPRGNRTVSGLAYPEDIQTGGTCSDHVMVDYCTEGKAVANEYCKAAGTVEKKALLKISQSRLDELNRANVGSISMDNVWLTDGGENSYKTCTVHTKESLETKPTEPEGDETPTTPAE